MDVLDLESPREVHVFNRGYQMGWDHCVNQDVYPNQESETATVDPHSISLLSPPGPSPDGVPPTGSKQTISPASSTSRDPESDSVLSWGSVDEADLGGLAASLGYDIDSPLADDESHGPSFEGWGTTPEGVNLDETDGCSYNEGFIDGIKLAIECAEAHEEGSVVYAHMVKDLSDLLALFEAISAS